MTFLADKAYLTVTTDDITQINKSFSIFYRAKTKEQMEKRMSQIHFFLCVNQSGKSISFNATVVN